VIQVALLLCLLTGCDKLWDLDHLPARGAVDSGGDGNDSASDVRPIDAFICTAIGHDEDADMLDDACDLCPTFYNPNDGDMDMDGLPDACDRNDAVSTHDRILKYWTFPTGDLSDFARTGSVQYDAASGGMMALGNASSLTTLASFRPTRIDFHLNSFSTTGSTSYLQIKLSGAVMCTIEGANCSGTIGQTCLRMTSTSSTVVAAPSALRRFELFQTSSATKIACKYGDQNNTISEPGVFVPSTIGIETSTTAQVKVEAIVLYGEN
jgi:hypothetical protein